MSGSAKNLPSISEKNDIVLGTVRQVVKTNLVFTGIDTSTPAGKRLFIKCRQNADSAARAAIGEKFKLCNCLVHSKDFADEQTGEVSTYLVAVLIDDQGRTIATTGSKVLDTLEDIVAMFGRPPWKPAIEVKVGQKPIGDDKSVITLDLV